MKIVHYDSDCGWAGHKVAAQGATKTFGLRWRFCLMCCPDTPASLDLDIDPTLYAVTQKRFCFFCQHERANPETPAYRRHYTYQSGESELTCGNCIEAGHLQLIDFGQTLRCDCPRGE